MKSTQLFIACSLELTLGACTTMLSKPQNASEAPVAIAALLGSKP